MDPIITGAAIGGVSSIIGGAMGRGQDTSSQWIGNMDLANRQIQEARDYFDKNAALQREFAQSGIQWRAQDAMAAGVHPLYALGTGVTPFSPTASMGVSGPGFTPPGDRSSLGRGIAEAGQNLARAVAAQETPEQRVMRDIQMEAALAGITKDYAQASYWQSEAARNRQTRGPGLPGAVTNPDFYFSPQNPDVRRGGLDIIQVQPSKVESKSSGDASVVASKPSLWQSYTYRDSEGKLKDMVLPSQAASEPLESVSESWLLQGGIVLENLRRNPNFLRDLFGIPHSSRSRGPGGGPIVEGQIRR